MNKQNLLPCPFCGSDAEYINRDDDTGIIGGYWDVGCDTNGCFMYTGADYWCDKVDITAMWNRRSEVNINE